jgi:uncharacterized protein YbaR (Trm112 family)
MNDWLMDLLACPRDGESLLRDGAHLSCARGHRYPMVDGIPVLLRDDVEQTGWWSHQSLAKANAVLAGENLREQSKTAVGEPMVVRKHVQEAIAATCGNLYSPLIGKLETYPIPTLRLPEGNGKLLLDVGCNWGRWSIAASRKGYRVVGMDPNLDAVPLTIACVRCRCIIVPWIKSLLIQTFSAGFPSLSEREFRLKPYSTIWRRAIHWTYFSPASRTSVASRPSLFLKHPSRVYYEKPSACLSRRLQYSAPRITTKAHVVHPIKK